MSRDGIINYDVPGILNVIFQQHSFCPTLPAFIFGGEINVSAAIDIKEWTSRDLISEQRSNYGRNVGYPRADELMYICNRACNLHDPVKHA
jgi:hypothetical protein